MKKEFTENVKREQIVKSYFVNFGIRDLCIAHLRAFNDPEAEEMIFAVLSESEKELQKYYESLYADLVSGTIDYFYHVSCGVIYLFTRSARAGVQVQRSAIWDKSGEMIPLSHADIDSFSEMVEKGFCIDNITIFAA